MIPSEFDEDLLTEDALDEHLDFESEHSDRGCTCFLSPPCSYCTHPGNPTNLMEDENAWQGEGATT